MQTALTAAFSAATSAAAAVVELVLVPALESSTSMAVPVVG